MRAGCRRCVDCEGAEHHWIPDCDDDTGLPLMVCKHCPARREYFDDDDGDACEHDVPFVLYCAKCSLPDDPSDEDRDDSYDEDQP
jgi:hypothetical protein